MIAKEWLTKKLKKELTKIRVYSVFWCTLYILTFLLKYIPLLNRIHYFFERAYMGFAMAYSDTTHAIRDCEEHHRVMGVSSEEISMLYESRSDEEKMKTFP
jgi:hypothetical protein